MYNFIEKMLNGMYGDVMYQMLFRVPFYSG